MYINVGGHCKEIFHTFSSMGDLCKSSEVGMKKHLLLLSSEERGSHSHISLPSALYPQPLNALLPRFSRSVGVKRFRTLISFCIYTIFPFMVNNLLPYFDTMYQNSVRSLLQRCIPKSGRLGAAASPIKSGFPETPTNLVSGHHFGTTILWEIRFSKI